MDATRKKWPQRPAANALGTAIEVEREDQFDAFCSVTATIASYFAFTETIAAWLGRTP